MKEEDIIGLASSQAENKPKLETVARVQDPINAAPHQLNEDLEGRDDDSLDEEDIPTSALEEELERAEFEPYTDDGMILLFFINCFILLVTNTSKILESSLTHQPRPKRSETSYSDWELQNSLRR